MSNYYDKEGKPLKMSEWVKLFENKDYKIVAQDTVNGYFISTVWLGLDHSFDGGKKLIFETMVFPSKENLSEEYCARYSTLGDAEVGHKRIVEKYK